MATSPIYGWLEPDNTDLVKNGALAIRTLGNAIDTTMGTMTPKSIVDAKGDLIAASANDTPARLAVGANGETLVADSSTATGLRYTAGTVQSNPVINSAFQVWQRGTANVTTGSAYTADRWQKGSGTHYGVSRQVTGDTTNLPNIQYCARVQRTSGSTTTNATEFAQSIETSNSIPFAGKTVTVSWYARKGADFSSTSSTMTMSLLYGTGTDQSVIGTYTGATYVINQSPATLTTTWQRFSATGTVATTATELALYAANAPVGTAGANDYYEITGVQMDIGSVALPFRTYAGTIQGELAACQRYYYRAVSLNSSAFPFFGNQYTTSSTVAYGQMILPVPMRVFPTSIETIAASNYGLQYASGRYGCTAISLDTTVNFSTNNSVPLTVTTTGATAGNVHFLVGNNTSSAYVGVSAEL